MNWFDELLDRIRQFFEYYLCWNTLTNRSVKWDDDLNDVSYTHSDDEYDRTSVPVSSTRYRDFDFADIYGRKV